MTIDDHAIESLRPWFNQAYEELKKEWISNQYENLSNCPSYNATAAYREAMNILVKAYYGNQHFKTLQELIEEDLELENFWKDKSK